jgi:hypothetical protein
VKGGLLLDVVVGEGAAVFELLAGEDQTLLVGGDTLLVYGETSANGRASRIFKVNAYPGSWT